MLTMSNDIDPWELPPLDFWAGRMLWKYLLILPFKVFFALPLMTVSSFFYIVFLPYSLPFSKVLHRLTFWAWRLFLGISLEIRDLRSDPHRRTKITVLNHASYMDGLVVGSVFYKFRTIAAFWAFSLPIYGHWLKASKSIPLYRAKENKNNAALIHADDSDSTITLTVEGTMTNGKGLIKFRTGAFIGKAEVQPVVLQYLNDEFNTCWVKMTSPLWKHLIMAISQVRNPVKVTFLEPYFPSDEEKENPTLYSENVRKYMSEQTGLPLIDATYKDSPVLKAGGE
ncbi:MAG: 1-acyl-sn-glycerol-3-phosphate acyltransferase [Myxococcota bacterium]|jgi:1-acyl-sn-glycerol-3-phosphate acyltransferase